MKPTTLFNYINTSLNTSTYDTKSACVHHNLNMHSENLMIRNSRSVYCPPPPIGNNALNFSHYVM